MILKLIKIFNQSFYDILNELDNIDFDWLYLYNNLKDF